MTRRAQDAPPAAAMWINPVLLPMDPWALWHLTRPDGPGVRRRDRVHHVTASDIVGRLNGGWSAWSDGRIGVGDLVRVTTARRGWPEPGPIGLIVHHFRIFRDNVSIVLLDPVHDFKVDGTPVPILRVAAYPSSVTPVVRGFHLLFPDAAEDMWRHWHRMGDDGYDQLLWV